MQRQRVVVPCEVALSVEALGVTMKKGRVAHHQISRLTPPLCGSSMNANALGKRAVCGVVSRLSCGFWLEFQSIHEGQGKPLRKHECKNA
jgi:hypothetical protein